MRSTNLDQAETLLLAGEMSMKDIAATIGCHLSAVHKRRQRLIAAGRIEPAESKFKSSPEIRVRFAEMRREGKSWSDIATAQGLTINQVKSVLRYAYRDDPSLRPENDNRRVYSSREERDRARAIRKREHRALLRAARPPVPQARKAAPADRPVTKKPAPAPFVAERDAPGVRFDCVSILDLPAHQDPCGCRWIEGRLSTGKWRYCQAATVDSTSWCAEHFVRVFRGDREEEAA